MSEAPPFWFQKPGFAAWMLAPLGAIYGALSARRMTAEPKYRSTKPVICIGNFVVGGAGKTPTALAMVKVIKNMGLKPGFLSRGYGGSVSAATLVDLDKHNSHDVGDEPLLLAAIAPTVVSVDRPAGSQLLEAQSIDVIIMDDGFQNPSLYKDKSMVVIDSGRALGNGFCMPAGPLRATMKTQLTRLSVLLLIGRAEQAAPLVRKVARMAKPIIQADIRLIGKSKFKGKNVLAFAGIADPAKFYASLDSVGANVKVQRSYHDHHPYSAEECLELLQMAKSDDLLLVTTEKDLARLKNRGEAQMSLYEAAQALRIELIFENPKMIEMLVREAIASNKQARLDI